MFWEENDIKDDLAGGRRGSDSPFQVFNGRQTIEFFKAMDLRSVGGKHKWQILMDREEANNFFLVE